MIPELGNFALFIAFGFSLLLSVLPFIGLRKTNLNLMATAPNIAAGMFAFTLIAFLCLVYAFMTDDFTVLNVAQNSNSALPMHYKFAASFGSHEGSFLLWLLMQSGWGFAVAIWSKSLPTTMRTRVLMVIGWICVGFYAYIITVSNPFDLTLPFYPVDGADLNPLLQDIGMIIHPPLLYMGYVGMSISFAFAIAALLSGDLDSAWAKWSRPWTAIAWSFLTLGLTIGSWWAYSELGWGGWWFWDPVENAAFMPWLVATALLHSLSVAEKRNAFKSWTVFLAIGAFSLSLLGTFLVRSGVIVSVHAFATDPARGVFILILLAIVIGGSLLLYSLKAGAIKSVGQFKIISRESSLWLNNVFLVAATLIVLLGTLVPLVHKEIGLGSISIGEPFFNQMFTYLIVPFALLIGIAPQLRWKQDKANKFVARPLVILLLSVAVSYLWIWLEFDNVKGIAWLATSLFTWICLFTLFELKLTTDKVPLFKLPMSHYAMVVGHIGLAFLIAGVGLTSQYSTERDVKMFTGGTEQLSGFDFKFQHITDVVGPNYEGWAAAIVVSQKGSKVAQLQAEKRFYPVQRNTMTEAAIDASFFRDIYVSLGEQLPDNGWALRLHVKPYVRWIWLGGLLVSFAGFLIVADKRYRKVYKNSAGAGQSNPIAEEARHEPESEPGTEASRNSNTNAVADKTGVEA